MSKFLPFDAAAAGGDPSEDDMVESKNNAGLSAKSQRQSKIFIKDKKRARMDHIIEENLGKVPVRWL